MCIMKSSELHRLIKRSGWKHLKSVPYHGAKEVGWGLLNKIIKVMNLNG